jgi:hypothetical protein
MAEAKVEVHERNLGFSIVLSLVTLCGKGCEM